MTDYEIHDVKLATLYSFRLMLKSDDKQQYTKEEVLQLIDQMAKSLKQQQD